MPGESILVVEDEVAVRDLIVTILEEEGYRVLGAGDGEEGLARMATAVPDLVVSDINMPKMGGYAFYDAVRARPHWDRVPFVFLTGQGEHRDVLAGKKLGADDYLVKPILPADLLVSVRARLDRQKRLDSLRDRQVAEVKNAILAVMNHEIRTPVTWLAGGAELLRDATADLDREQVRQVLDGILAGSERLVRLAENLVFLVDVQTGEARRTFEERKRLLPDLSDLLRECLRFAEPRARAEGVRLMLEAPGPPPLVAGDADMMMAAVHRLLDNAIKFSKGPEAEVTLALFASGPRTVIEVRDRGVGVRPEDLSRITDLFVQSGREKQEQQGTGSGLTIAREVAALHGGTLELTSEHGKGTTARLVLPAAERP
jgi:two-component system, sensor histidine kinase and response regulator